MLCKKLKTRMFLCVQEPETPVFARWMFRDYIIYNNTRVDPKQVVQLSNSQRLEPFQLAVVNSDLLGWLSACHLCTLCFFSRRHPCVVLIAYPSHLRACSLLNIPHTSLLLSSPSCTPPTIFSCRWAC